MHFTATETFQLQFSASAVAEDVTSAAHSAGNFFRSKVECSDYARSHQFANQILSHAIGLDMALASGFFQFGGDGVQSVNDDGAVVAGFALNSGVSGILLMMMVLSLWLITSCSIDEYTVTVGTPLVRL